MINKTFVNMKLNWQPKLCCWNEMDIYNFKQNCAIEPADLLHFFDKFDYDIFVEMLNDGTLDSVPLKDLVEAFRLYYQDNRKDGKVNKLLKGKVFDNESLRPSNDNLLEILSMQPAEFCRWFIEYLEMSLKK